MNEKQDYITTDDIYNELGSDIDDMAYILDDLDLEEYKKDYDESFECPDLTMLIRSKK